MTIEIDTKFLGFKIGTGVVPPGATYHNSVEYTVGDMILGPEQGVSINILSPNEIAVFGPGGTMFRAGKEITGCPVGSRVPGVTRTLRWKPTPECK